MIRFVPRPRAPTGRGSRRSVASDTPPVAWPTAEVVRPDFVHHQPPRRDLVHGGPANDGAVHDGAVHGGPGHGGPVRDNPVDDGPALGADAAGHAADTPADDYRDRMVANLAGLAVLAILIAGGLWIAVTMADQRKSQDCVLSGRPACTPIPVQVQVPAPKLPPGP
ncbi:hypothetical protein [Rhodoplanes azumiensis]|uniref:Uncharacterized protein n=1 Tax=Rhodoplanes azumiensis TaxID=1897628 RepID=A0ABW5AL11_9BRAD